MIEIDRRRKRHAHRWTLITRVEDFFGRWFA